MTTSTKPRFDILRLTAILTIAIAGLALIWTGVTLHGLGETRLGLSVAGIGGLVFTGAAQVEI